MRKLSITAGTLSLLLYTSSVCFACDCLTLSQAESFRRADLVFEGEVIRITQSGIETAYTFRVQKVLKGQAQTEVVLHGGGTDCDDEFSPDTTYLVYARYYEDKLITSICSGNKVLRVSRKDATSAVVSTDSSTASKNRYAIIILGGAVICALLFWLWSHRRAST